jgi:DNA-directed RNA polymerase specialized sigma24 family protein
MLDGLDKMAWFDRAAFEGRQYERRPTDTVATADSPAAQGGTAERPPSCRLTRNDLENVALMSREADAGAASLHLELVMFLRDLLSALPEKEAALVRGTFFEGRTLTEAARRVGISTAWASRLQTRTLADLRIALERGGFV